MVISNFSSVISLCVLQGFCGWTLVNYDRLLLPANAQVGVLRHKEHYYAFATKTAAQEFAANPDQ